MWKSHKNHNFWNRAKPYLLERGPPEKHPMRKEFVIGSSAPSTEGFTFSAADVAVINGKRWIVNDVVVFTYKSVLLRSCYETCIILLKDSKKKMSSNT